MHEGELPRGGFAVVDDRLRDRLVDRTGNEARQRVHPLDHVAGIERGEKIAIEFGDAAESAKSVGEQHQDIEGP